MAAIEYKLVGNFHILPEKQAEFNDCVLTVLNYFGVKKTTTISIDDKSLVVTEQVAIDEYGKISFNYCTLENKQHDTSVFSVIIGNFEQENCGYEELGVARNLLLTISAAFSSTPCFLLRNGHPMRMRNLLHPLNYIFNREFSCHKVWDIWEIYSFFHYCDGVDDITPLEAWHTVATDLGKRTQNQMDTLLLLETEDIPLFSNPKSYIKEKSSKEKWYQREELLFTILTKNKDDNDFIFKLRDLLSKPFEERIKFVDGTNEDMALLALLSLHYYAPVIVKALSLVFYKRIMPFQNMFYEFIEHSKQKEYLVAVLLLQELADENKYYGKVIEHCKGPWDLCVRTFNTGRLRIKRYLAVMANKKLRRKYFDF